MKLTLAEEVEAIDLILTKATTRDGAVPHYIDLPLFRKYPRAAWTEEDTTHLFQECEKLGLIQHSPSSIDGIQSSDTPKTWWFTYIPTKAGLRWLESKEPR